MDSRKPYATSLPCVSQSTISGFIQSTSSLHGNGCKVLNVRVEPIKAHFTMDLLRAKSETNISRPCKCSKDGGVSVAKAPLQLDSEQQRNMEWCYLCAHCGPLVQKKYPDSLNFKVKTKLHGFVSLSTPHKPLASVGSCHSSISTQDAERIESANNSEQALRIMRNGLDKLKESDACSLQNTEDSNGMLSKLNESCGLMCRICHSGDEDEGLMTPCRCTGTVKYAHQSCILSWISKSGSETCELCKFKFKTRKKKVKYFWKWSFPEVSTKGWLHIGLFVAFATMLLTSITWIAWSRISRAPTAVAERTTEEVKFAYMLNGLFIALAIGGLYFDSYKHFKKYFKRWTVLNQHVVVESYTREDGGSNKCGNSRLSWSNDTRHSSISIGMEATERERILNRQVEPVMWV